MTIEQFAQFYVDVLEPALRLAGFFVLVVLVLYLVNIMKDGGRRSNFFSSSISYSKKAIVFMARIFVVGVRWLGEKVVKLYHGIIDTYRRFRASKN